MTPIINSRNGLFDSYLKKNQGKTNFYVNAKNNSVNRENNVKAKNVILKSETPFGGFNDKTNPESKTAAYNQSGVQNSGDAAKYDEAENSSENSEASHAEQSLEKIYRQIENTKTDGEGIDAFAKCLKIAARIMRGDIVPKKDNDFLFDNYPRLHLQAWTLRQAKENPEKCKSVLKDEKDDEKEQFPTYCGESADSAGVGLNMSVEGLDISV